MKKLKTFIIIYKMGNTIITFGNIEVEKHKFHQHKCPILIYDVDISKTVVSSKLAFGKKYCKCFFGYKCRKLESKKVRKS